MNKNIKRSFTFAILMLSVFFMVLIGGVVYYKTTNTIEKLEIQNQIEIAKQRAVIASNAVGNTLSEEKKKLKSFKNLLTD